MKSINLQTSLALPVLRFNIKLACFKDTPASPILLPFKPHKSISFPAECPGGFLKIQPADGLDKSWESLRYLRYAFILSLLCPFVFLSNFISALKMMYFERLDIRYPNLISFLFSIFLFP